MTKVRPMDASDIPAAERVWFSAGNALRATQGLPVEQDTTAEAQRTQARIRHLLCTDPAGSWVAEDDDGGLVGLAQALIREDLWVLSLLGVAPRCQARGVGKALLEEALSYGRSASKGIILSSPDPKAMRRYTVAGFDLHPSVSATGAVKPGHLKPSGRVRSGSINDLDAVDDVSRTVRGGPCGIDIEMLLTHDCRLLILDDMGYVVARGARPVCLAARTEDAATDLLVTCLSAADGDEQVEIKWITSQQQWAIRVAVDVGLAFRPIGPVMTRGMTAPTTFLPSGAYG